MLNALDICAGSAIGSAVFEAIGLARTVCYVEIDDYCQRLIQQRIADGWLADAPIWDDLRSFDGRPWRGLVDFVFGGIPCQPWSVAGQRKGAADARDLWPDFLRVVGEVRPRLVLVENVSGFLTVKRGGPRTRTARDGHVIARWTEKAQQSAIGRAVGDLSEIGYDAQWDVVSAAGVGAPHLRKLVWVVAYSDQFDGWPDVDGRPGKQVGAGGSDIPDPSHLRGQAIEREQPDGVLPGDVADALSQHDDRGRHGAGAVCGEQSGEAELRGSGEEVPDPVSRGCGSQRLGRMGRTLGEWREGA